MNKVILAGRTCAEWKTRKYGEGKSFVTNTLAIQEGKDKAEFVSVTAFGKTAEVLYKYVKKGDMVLLEGSIHTSLSEKDGKKQYFTSVIVLRAELLPSPYFLVFHSAQVLPAKITLFIYFLLFY